jgi:hypothetical protein
VLKTGLETFPLQQKWLGCMSILMNVLPNLFMFSFLLDEFEWSLYASAELPVYKEPPIPFRGNAV